MGDAEEDKPEGEEEPQEEPETGIFLTVKVGSLKGIPEGTEGTTVSYSYQLSPEPADPEAEDNPEPVILEANSEPFEEPPEGPIHKYDLETRHKLPPVDDVLFYKLIKLPLEVRVEGLVQPGKVSVPLTNLVWKQDPRPDDPDDEEYLPGFPGAFIRGWYPVQLDGELEEEQTWPEDLQIYIDVNISELLGSEDDLKDLNILTLDIPSMHRLPPLFGPNEGEEGEDHPYTYTFNFQLPGSADMVNLTVEPGEIKAKEPEPEPEEGEEGAEGAEGEKAEGEGAEGAEGTEGEGGEAKAEPAKPKEEEDTFEYLQTTQSKVSMKEEIKGAKIEFNYNYSAALLASTAAQLKQMLLSRAPLAIELTRKLRSGEDYVYLKKYHGKVEVDLSALLTPGETKVHVRVPIGPADDYARPTEEELEELPPPGGEPEEDEDANPYLLAESYIILTLNLLKPLVAKPKPKPPVLPKVGDLLPTRPPVEKVKHELSSNEQFTDDVKGIVTELADVYGTMFLGEQDVNLSPEGVEARRQQTIFHLNSSGRYYDFKEKLKKSITRIVTERFHKSGLDPTTEDGKRFVAQLYVHLQEKVNVCLNEVFNPKQAKAAKVTDEQQLKKLLKEEFRLAVEAEINLDYTLAASHLNQRIILAASEAILWYEYGSMLMRQGDIAKAEECLRESLSLDPRHSPALLSYGVLLCIRDKYADAETYFKGASEYNPEDVIAWSMLMLFYDMESRDLERRASLKKVLLIEKQHGAGKKSAYLRAGAFAVELKGLQLVERAAAQEFVKNGPSEDLSLMLARAYLGAEQFDRSRQNLQDALSKDKRCAVAMTLMGHNFYIENLCHKLRSDEKDSVAPAALKEVISWYERALTQRTPNIDILQYVRLARLYLWTAKYYQAKDTLLKACKLSSSATTWLGLAISCYKQEELDQAEEALSEANILDPKNAEVWGMLCIVNIRQGRMEEAEMSLQRALRLSIGTSETFPVDQFIVEQIGNLLFKAGRYSSAASAVQRALLSSQHPQLHILLARIYVEENDLPSACQSYLAVAEDGSDASSELKKHCLEQLIVLAQSLKRQGDVNKYSQMLQKITQG